jgi:S-adenosylmethionine synthetase
LHDKIIYHINPTGIFLEGTPGDCGLTGRKIIVDSYGGRGRHGGGAFSGRTRPRSTARRVHGPPHRQKHCRRQAGRQCEVQLSYAIGYPDPLSIWLTTNGTVAKGVTEDRLISLIRDHFQLTPGQQYANLRRPIYQATAAHGHFGRELPEFTWEKTDKAEEVRASAKVTDYCWHAMKPAEHSVFFIVTRMMELSLAGGSTKSYLLILRSCSMRRLLVRSRHFL